MPSVISGAPREILEMSLGSTQGALSDDTSRGTKGVSMIDLRNCQVGISRWSEVGGGTPLPPRGSKSYTIVKTLNLQKILNFETMKNFLKGVGL